MVILRVVLATDLGRCGPETIAAAECEEHVSAQALGSIPERKSSEVFDGQAEQQIVDVFSDSGRVEDSSVNFIFIRDDWRASPCPPATTQNLVATSSGEAEFYALAKSALESSWCSVKPRVRVDATASNGMDSRLGVGSVRHLQTEVWKRWPDESWPSRECQGAKPPGRFRHETLG